MDCQKKKGPFEFIEAFKGDPFEFNQQASESTKNIDFLFYSDKLTNT